MTFEIAHMEPIQGPPKGNNLVRLTGSGFTNDMEVYFDGLPAPRLLLEDNVCYVHAPPHARGAVPVAVSCRGQRVNLATTYTYAVPLTQDSGLTRLVRTLLRKLKEHYLQNASVTVDVESAAFTEDGTAIGTFAQLPALVLSGPDIRENRVHSAAVGPDACDAQGNFIQYPTPYVADLHFSLTGASQSTSQLLNMVEAAISFLHQDKWLHVARDEDFPELGTVRWPQDLVRGH